MLEINKTIDLEKETKNVREEPRGISFERKEKIIKSLGPLMFNEKLEFWETLFGKPGQRRIVDFK